MSWSWRATFLFSLAFSSQLHAFSDVVCRLYETGCASGSSAPSANPSTSNRVRVNPSAVPLEKSLGIEAIVYKSEGDFGLVRGLGRVGAAISPSNSEETFFGPPGFETPEDLLLRKKKTEKYPSHKVTLAGAFKLLGNNRSGLQKFTLNMGLMGKFNSQTNVASPGGGLTGVLGPLTFGYSVYQDETQLDFARYGIYPNPKIQYNVSAYTFGIFLNSIILDYSSLRIMTADPATVNITTFSVLLKKFIFTFSKRLEDSDRPNYNFRTDQLITERTKEEYFGGIQYKANRRIMAGVLYNYYLMREISGSFTLFF